MNPITDAPTEARKVFCTYERSVQPKQYETEKASLIVQADIELGADDGQIETAISNAFSIAKANVLDQLGLPTSFDGRKVVEASGSATPVRTDQPPPPAADAFPEDAEGQAMIAAQAHDTTQVPENIAQAFPGAQQQQGTQSQGSKYPLKRATGAPGDPACPFCGSVMWDNRAKKASGEWKPNGPDFSCRRKKDDGCQGVIWPPR